MFSLRFNIHCDMLIYHWISTEAVWRNQRHTRIIWTVTQASSAWHLKVIYYYFICWKSFSNLMCFSSVWMLCKLKDVRDKEPAVVAWFSRCWNHSDTTWSTFSLSASFWSFISVLRNSYIVSNCQHFVVNLSKLQIQIFKLVNSCACGK